MDISKVALLIIDMQHASLDQQGSLIKLTGAPANWAESIVEPIKQLKKVFRDANRPVIYNVMALKKDYSDAGLLGKVFPPLFQLGHCIDDTWDYEIIDDLKPEEGDIVIKKNRWSGFFNTALDTQLRCMGIETLIVVGVATDVCVSATVRDAFYRDYQCIVPLETTASFSKEDYERGIQTMAFGAAKIVNLKEVMDLFK